MKKFCLIIFAVASGASACAQTNSALPMPRGLMQIHSDSADFDMAARKAIYRGHVRVNDPQMKLTCAFLTAILPAAGGRVDRIVAETNVVIDFTDEKRATNHVTSDKAVYDYIVKDALTNETVTLTGHPKIVNAQGTNTADKIVWDRTNGSIHETNPHMEGQNLGGGILGTNNSSPAKLF